jgi:membrane-bound lytic murein transglycosylase B
MSGASWVRRATPALGTVAPALVLLLALVALAAAPVAAQADPTLVPTQVVPGGTPPTAPAEGAGLLPGLDARLVGVPLEYGPSSADVQALKDAEARVAALTQERDALRARQVDLDVRTAVLDEMQRQAAIDLEQAETDRRRLSALVYSKGGTAWQAQALLQTEDAMELQRVNHLGQDFSAALREAILRAQIARRRASEETVRLALERVGVDERLAQVEFLELPAATKDAEALRILASSSVAGGAVAGLGIPLATLDAYLRAEAALAFERPQCEVQWWMLAGIGRVESNHGRYGGAQLIANGDTAPRIIGIALDGAPGVAAIADSDGGIWDGDVTWDRAVGPMQFIPGTWRRYQADGNGDGASDPNNVYDAAYGAGRYLCNAAGRMGDDATLTRAYLAYNHSDTYAAHVLNLARTYQTLGIPKAAG